MSALMLSERLEGDLRDVSRARRMLGTSLADWGIGEDASDALLLCVSEVVTNAIVHAEPPVRLVAQQVEGAVRVEVHDGDRRSAPEVRRQSEESPDGRGLMLVDALTRAWGSRTTALGKIVWFEVAVGV